MKTRLALASVTALADPARFTEGLARVSGQRREKVARIRAEGAKRLSLGAALLLDRMLADLGLGPAGDFAFGPQGKPYLPERPDIHFSLSHSGGYVLCALSDSELGCDVEAPRPAKPELAARFFHPLECDWLFSLPPREQENAFLRLWTLKESYLKAVGLGLSLPLNSFCILPKGEGFALSDAQDARLWTLRSFVYADCFCAVCAHEATETLEFLNL